VEVAAMSGPVWRFEAGMTVVCDECLVETDRAYVEGAVKGAEFAPGRHLCERCYEDNIHLIAAREA
jgi:hypothetical protein